MKLSFSLLLAFSCLAFAEDEIVDEIAEGAESGDPVKSDGLIVETIEMPDSCEKKAENGDFLEVRYTGRFDNGEGDVFDSSEGKENYGFQLGAGQVRDRITVIKKYSIYACTTHLP